MSSVPQTTPHPISLPETLSVVAVTQVRGRLNHPIRAPTRSAPKSNCFQNRLEDETFSLQRKTKQKEGGKYSPTRMKRETSGFDNLETIQVCATVVSGTYKCHFPSASEAKISKLTPPHGLRAIPCKMTTNNFIINKLAQKSSLLNLISGERMLIL